VLRNGSLCATDVTVYIANVVVSMVVNGSLLMTFVTISVASVIVNVALNVVRVSLVTLVAVLVALILERMIHKRLSYVYASFIVTVSITVSCVGVRNKCWVGNGVSFIATVRYVTNLVALGVINVRWYKSFK
jgi:hypothetical protein